MGGPSKNRSSTPRSDQVARTPLKAICLLPAIGRDGYESRPGDVPHARSASISSGSLTSSTALLNL